MIWLKSPHGVSSPCAASAPLRAPLQLLEPHACHGAHIHRAAHLGVTRQRVDPLRSKRQKLAGVAPVRFKSGVGGFGADVDELPLNRLVADDFGVGAHVGGAGRVGRKLDQVRAIGDLLTEPHRNEPIPYHAPVSGFALASGVQLADGAVDQLVVAAVEIPLGQDVSHPRECGRRQQQGAQHVLLGVDGLRRNSDHVGRVHADTCRS